ncbi:hypothetical protein D3C71_1889970 [compost metagenome]
MVIVGLSSNHLPQKLLHHIRFAGLLGKHCLVVQQFDIVRGQGDQLTLYLVRILVEALIAQQLDFGQQFHPLLIG